MAISTAEKLKNFDKIDTDILTVLYQNADITNKDLADCLDIATSTCQERVKKLKKLGVIKGYQCELDLAQFSGHIEAMAAVKMVKHTGVLADKLRDDLLELPEVIQVFHMGGENDFNVHIAVYNTAHLRQLIFREFTSRSEVLNVETSLIFEHRRSKVLPKLDFKN
jgi:DNA-binding Lrp family transcriptional regulator